MIRKTLITIFLVLILLIVGAGVYGFVKGPSYIKTKIEDSVKEGCPRCKISIGDVAITPMGQVTFNDIIFKVDPSDPTQVAMACRRLTLNPQLTTLRSEIKVLDSVTFDGLEVYLTETFKENPPKPDPAELKQIESSYGGKFLEGLPPLVIKEINISDSQFHYGMKKFGHEAKLPITKIEAHISEIGTRKTLGQRFINADLTAKLENSGSVIIKIQADLFSVKNEDRLDVEVKHQKMDELNSFFAYEDGLTMGGLLKDARGDIFMSQGKMTGHFSTEYEDLTLSMKPTPEHGLFKTLLSNLLQKAVITKTKPSKGKPTPQIDVAYERKPGESVIQFILFGLKDAAMKAVSQ